jgi:hypothetical protein
VNDESQVEKLLRPNLSRDSDICTRFWPGLDPDVCLRQTYFSSFFIIYDVDTMTGAFLFVCLLMNIQSERVEVVDHVHVYLTDNRVVALVLRVINPHKSLLALIFSTLD